MKLAPFKFACDQGPASGVIVGREGPCTIVRGTGNDEGSWFAKGKGQTRRFNSRQEAMDWAKTHGTDSGVENMRRFKTQNAMDAEPGMKQGKLDARLKKYQEAYAQGKISRQELDGFIDALRALMRKSAQDKLPDFVKYAARQAVKK